MTLTTREYTHLRTTFVQGDDAFEITRRIHATLWYQGGGVRVLVFDSDHLEWTGWFERREDAIDAALERAKWIEGERREYVRY